MLIQVNLHSARPEEVPDRVIETATFAVDVRTGEIGPALGTHLPHLVAGARDAALGLTRVEAPASATLHLYEVIVR